MLDSSSITVNNILSSGIADISASAVLIGCQTAESLTLGSRGTAGLPWAVMSFVRKLGVVPACVAAITPGWLHEKLAVRSSETDAGLGWSLHIGRTMIQKRRLIGTAAGLTRKVRPAGLPL
jgi:hypothetical protein